MSDLFQGWLRIQLFQGWLPGIQKQREAVEEGRRTLAALDRASVNWMCREGIMAPYYGGEHLGKKRGVVPLWVLRGEGEKGPQLLALVLRHNLAGEHSGTLRGYKRALHMPNHLTWKGDLEPILMQRGVRLYQGRLGRWKDFAFFIPACSLRAAPGFALEECLRHVASDKPFAVFPVLPGLAAGDADWQEVGAILLYADSPQLLEAAVWEFWANGVLASDEFDDGEEASGYRWPDGQPWTLGDLAAEFCFRALCEITLYGATAPAGDCGSGAPVLDVVRSQDSIPTLRCVAPLRRSVEPNRFAAEEVRGQILAQASEGELLLQLSPESIADVWPRIGSARFYALRLRQGIIGEAADGQPVLAGGQEDPIVEWLWADTLEELYRLVRLGRIYEYLALTDTISASAIWNR